MNSFSKMIAFLLIWPLGFFAARSCLSLAKAEDAATLNERVLAFCKSHMSEKVGSGSCSDLARKAFESAGAELRIDGDPEFGKAWGEALESIEEAKPGDVLTFHDVHFVHVLGNPSAGGVKHTFDFPDHVAIVKSVVKTRRKRVVLRVLHQNVHRNGDKGNASGVQEDTLYLDERKPGGWMRVYRPIARKVLKGKSLQPNAKATSQPDSTDSPEFRFEEEKRAEGQTKDSDQPENEAEKKPSEPRSKG